MNRNDTNNNLPCSCRCANPYHQKMIDILRAVLIILGTHIHLSSAQINTTCLHVPENDCFQSAFATTESSCEGWICWESQLTLSNKRFITVTLNQFRNSGAHNVSNMNKVIWHWTLEQEALRASSTCQRRYLEHYEERRDIPGLGLSLLCENGCMYREGMVLPSQTLFKQLLYSFLREGGIQLQHKYSNEESFRRGNAQFIGCSLVVTRSIIENSYENTFVFVCVLCTRDKEWQTIYSDSAEKQCSPPGIHGADKKYPNLCRDAQLRNIFLCEPENPCPYDERTEIWQTEFEGRVSRLSFVQTNTGPLLLVNESLTQVNHQDDGTAIPVTTIQTYVDTEGNFVKHFQIHSPLPESIYFHSQQQVVLYNAILHSSLGPNISCIYLENPGVCEVVTPAAATEGTADASCCFYLLLGTILTTIILGGLFAYTVDYYRKKNQ